MEKKLRVIDQDFVREVRRTQGDQAAKKLIETHLKDIKKAGKDAVKDITKIHRKVKKALGICTNLDCKKKAEDGVFCKECGKSIHKASNKWKKKINLKYDKKCPCGKSIYYLSKDCTSCSAKKAHLKINYTVFESFEFEPGKIYKASKLIDIIIKKLKLKHRDSYDHWTKFGIKYGLIKRLKNRYYEILEVK